MGDFRQLGVDKRLIQGLNDLGITIPTEIQEAVIPLLLQQGGDLVAQAQTGTGKTAAFGLPLLQQIDPSKNYIQGLILCPTRELGKQIAKQLFKFTKYSDKIFTECVYGGEQIDLQINRLTRTTHIIVATPGRLIDLLKKKALSLTEVKTVILDEADEMLSMGFKKELNEILRQLPSVKNKWMFSATMPDGVREMVDAHLSPRASNINLAKKSVINKNILHQFVKCEELDKLMVLIQFLKSEKNNRGVIFCRTKNSAKKLGEQLMSKNITAAVIQGDMLQKERDKSMRSFQNESSRILIATDLAARGIDVTNLEFVVHYELPDSEEYYIHRSGRTARGGQKGNALSIVTGADMKRLRFLEKKLNIQFKQIR